MSLITIKEPEVKLPAAHADPLLALIERVACDPSADVAKMRELLEMHQSLQGRQAEKLFGAAMAAAQQEMEPIRADSDNKQTKSKYASYAALDRALRPIYTKHGFAPSFDTVPSGHDTKIRLVCDVFHRDGHTRRYTLEMDADGKGAKGGDVMTKTHATGSALTYGQRYMLKMIFNIPVDTDDDGNKASDQDKRITDKQADELLHLAEQAGADKAAFCKVMKVESFADIPAPQFFRAKSFLQTKLLRAKAESYADL